MSINVALLGCGMMGQEHVSYMSEYKDLHLKFVCDPNPSSVEKTLTLLTSKKEKKALPQIFTDEKDMLQRVSEIDLLVIATPNYLHTPQLLRWANHPISILVEKPVAICERQVRALRAASPSFRANIWVAMEYRYIPAIQKLIQLLPQIGPIKSITIRENRYPFLSKIEEWNKDIDKSGDTLVEKCCHFFDLFRLISHSEMHTCCTKVHRGLLSHDYGYHERKDNPTPIIDAAYVLLDFYPPSHDHHDDEIGAGTQQPTGVTTKVEEKEAESKQEHHRDHYSSSPVSASLQQAPMGCLELCMFAEGSRHQEEIVVTGMKGRLEAYLPENKVFFYQRPTRDDWPDRSKPPPKSSIREQVIDCSDLNRVYDFADEIPRHCGYHYCSTAIEWKYLIDAIKTTRDGGKSFVPQVSLQDGIAAVEMGIVAMKNITNKSDHERRIGPIVAFGSKSSEHLLNLAIGFALEAQTRAASTEAVACMPSLCGGLQDGITGLETATLGLDIIDE